MYQASQNLYVFNILLIQVANRQFSFLGNQQSLSYKWDSNFLTTCEVPGIYNLSHIQNDRQINSHLPCLFLPSIHRKKNQQIIILIISCIFVYISFVSFFLCVCNKVSMYIGICSKIIYNQNFFYILILYILIYFK